jgi:hypothetical protein
VEEEAGVLRDTEDEGGAAADAADLDKTEAGAAVGA